MERKLNDQWVEEFDGKKHMLKAPPSDSNHKSIDGVVCTPENAVQPVFSIGDKIRFKSTGTIEKVGEISHGGRYINSVNVEDIEKISEGDYCNSKPFTEEVRML